MGRAEDLESSLLKCYNNGLEIVQQWGHFKVFESYHDFSLKTVTLYICLHVPVEFYPTLCDSMGCSSPGLSLWNFSGKNIRVGNHSFLQGIFPGIFLQGSNPILLHLPQGQVDSLPLSQLGSPYIFKVAKGSATTTVLKKKLNHRYFPLITWFKILCQTENKIHI